MEILKSNFVIAVFNKGDSRIQKFQDIIKQKCGFRCIPFCQFDYLKLYKILPKDVGIRNRYNAEGGYLNLEEIICEDMLLKNPSLASIKLVVGRYRREEPLNEMFDIKRERKYHFLPNRVSNLKLFLRECPVPSTGFTEGSWRFVEGKSICDLHHRYLKGLSRKDVQQMLKNKRKELQIPRHKYLQKQKLAG